MYETDLFVSVSILVYDKTTFKFLYCFPDKAVLNTANEEEYIYNTSNALMKFPSALATDGRFLYVTDLCTRRIYLFQ